MAMPTGEHCWKKNSGAPWARNSNIWIPSLTRSPLSYLGRYVEWDLKFNVQFYIYILGLANALIVETKFLELAMSLLDFSPRIPLGTFSILLVATMLHLTAEPHSRPVASSMYFVLKQKILPLMKLGELYVHIYYYALNNIFFILLCMHNV